MCAIGPDTVAGSNDLPLTDLDNAYEIEDIICRQGIRYSPHS